MKYRNPYQHTNSPKSTAVIGTLVSFSSINTLNESTNFLFFVGVETGSQFWKSPDCFLADVSGPNYLCHPPSLHVYRVPVQCWLEGSPQSNLRHRRFLKYLPGSPKSIFRYPQRCDIWGIGRNALLPLRPRQTGVIYQLLLLDWPQSLSKLNPINFIIFWPGSMKWIMGFTVDPMFDIGRIIKHWFTNAQSRVCWRNDWG